jgi:hypothetical protein
MNAMMMVMVMAVMVVMMMMMVVAMMIKRESYRSSEDSSVGGSNGVGEIVVMSEETRGDVEGDCYIDGVMLVCSQDEEHPKEVEHPRRDS